MRGKLKGDGEGEESAEEVDGDSFVRANDMHYLFNYQNNTTTLPYKQLLTFQLNLITMVIKFLVLLYYYFSALFTWLLFQVISE